MPDSSPWPDLGEPAALLVVVRFRVPAAERQDFLREAETILGVLARQAGLRRASIVQSTDDADLLALRSEWDSVGAYRRALSDMDMKVHGIPFLARAIDEPTAFEVLQHVGDDADPVSSSAFARDAGDVRLGQAAAADVTPLTSRADES